MAVKVLVVDDEKLIVKGLKFSLEQDDMEVECAYDGEEALEYAKNNQYDIILLDIMLPKLDGMQVCQQIREFSNVPIIMLTAKGDDMDKILGLEYGADDYVTKPFNILEVKARMKAILRRNNKSGSKPVQTNIINAADMKLDCDSRSLYIAGREINLTSREFDILELLVKNPGKVYSRDNLLKKVWGEEYPGDARTVDVHVRRLREKIESNPSEPKYVHTRWGVGYITMPDNIKNNKRTDDFNKVKKNFKKLLFRMKSTKTWIFIFFVGLLAAVMIIVENVSYYFFQKNLIEIEMAQLQTSAAVMSGEFSSYASFSEAEKNGVYERMRRYSAMNSVRIRVIDERFVIVSDSYLVEYGRNIINSNVINSFTTGKSISFYDRKNTNIEVAVPINGTDGSILGVLVVSKDLDEVYKNSVNDNIFTVMVAVTAVAVILVLLFERGIGKSYRKAYKIVEDVANGHTDKRIPVKGSYELRLFAKDFNNIMDRAGMLDESRQEFVSNVSMN